MEIRVVEDRGPALFESGCCGIKKSRAPQCSARERKSFRHSHHFYSIFFFDSSSRNMTALRGQGFYSTVEFQEYSLTFVFRVPCDRNTDMGTSRVCTHTVSDLEYGKRNIPRRVGLARAKWRKRKNGAMTAARPSKGKQRYDRSAGVGTFL